MVFHHIGTTNRQKRPTSDGGTFRLLATRHIRCRRVYRTPALAKCHLTRYAEPRPVTAGVPAPKFHDGFGWAKVRQLSPGARANTGNPTLVSLLWPD